jgi:hypothetical protein
VASTVRNSFVALCNWASSEGWCWKIFCTTCGHMNFRYGLREIADGNHPDSSGWRVSAYRSDLARGSPAADLGPMPRRPPWPIEEQRRLIAVLSTASVTDIARDCPFPDWLGYLGLGLHYSEDAERATRALTANWIPQLIELLPPHSLSIASLRKVLDNSGMTLSWQMLSRVESGFYE